MTRSIKPVAASIGGVEIVVTPAARRKVRRTARAAAVAGGYAAGIAAIVCTLVAVVQSALLWPVMLCGGGRRVGRHDIPRAQARGNGRLEWELLPGVQRGDGGESRPALHEKPGSSETGGQRRGGERMKKGSYFGGYILGVLVTIFVLLKMNGAI